MHRTIIRTVRLTGLTVLLGIITAQMAIGAPAAVLKTPAAPAKGKSDRPTVVTAGDSNVATRTGAFQYSVPIAVPPGRLGMAPTIALNYSSQAPIYGTLASGWSLSGFPEIRHDVSDGRQASDYRGFVPGTRDRLYVSDISGRHRLVKVTEPAGVTVKTTYRAKVDAVYVQYRRMDEASEFVWEARYPSGTVQQFGHAAHITGGVIKARAPLTKTIDKFGNTINYYYRGGVDYTPSKIEYTLNLEAGLGTPHAEVRFKFLEPAYCGTSHVPVGARFDYSSGEIVYPGARKLTSITTRALKNDGTDLRTVSIVRLDYDSTAEDCGGRHGAQRRLKAVHRTAYNDAGQSVSLPPTTFSYGALERAMVEVDDPAIAAPPGAPAGALVWGRRYNSTLRWPTVDAMLLDFDGDGFKDRLYVDPKHFNAQNDWQCSFMWQPGSAKGFGEAKGPVFLPTLPWSENGAPSGGEAAAGNCSLSGQRVFLDNLQGDPAPCGGDPESSYFPIGWFPESWFGADGETFTPGNIGSYLSYRFLNIAGKDGRPDLVATLNYDPRYFKAAQKDAFKSLGLGQPSCGPSVGACPDLTSHDANDLIQCKSSCDPSSLVCTAQEPRCEPDYDRFFAAVDGAPRVPCSMRTARAPANPTDPFRVSRCGQYLIDNPLIETADGQIVDLDRCRKSVVACSGGDGADSTCLPGDSVVEDTDQPLTRACKPGRFPQLACNEYVWHVWKNQGGGQLSATATAIRSPVPLVSMSGEGTIGGSKHGLISTEHGVLDLNGDGHLDVFTRDQHVRSETDTVELASESMWWWVWFGDGDGGFHGLDDGKRTPYAWWVPRRAKPSATLESPGYDHTGKSILWWGAADAYTDPLMKMRAGMTQEGLYDVNGDGRPDYLRVNDDNGKVEVHYNSGLDFMYRNNQFEWLSSDDTDAISATRTDVLGWEATSRWVSTATRSTIAGFADVDVDGRVDVFSPLVSYGTVGVESSLPSTSSVIRMNTGGPVTDNVHVIEDTDPLDQGHGFSDRVRTDSKYWWVTRRYTDLTGDGRPDMFGFQRTGKLKTDDPNSADTPMRLLHTVDNGIGQTIEVKYAVHTDVAVVTQDRASGMATSNHTWVVKSVDVVTGSTGPSVDTPYGTFSSGDPVATTTYHYYRPVTKPDWRGRHAFRGFEQVATTGPSGAVVLERYGYDVDWSGRLVERVTYASSDDMGNAALSTGAADLSRPHSIKRTFYKRYPLFANKVEAYHPTTEISWQCERDSAQGPTQAPYQTKKDCEAEGARRTRATTWEPKTHNGATVLYVPAAVVELAGDAETADGVVSMSLYGEQPEDRSAKTSYALDYDEATYRLRTVGKETRQLLGDKLVTKTAYEYAPDFLKAPIKVHALARIDTDGTERWATTETKYHRKTGLPELVYKPMQLEKGLHSKLEYDAHKVFVVRTTNELGHVVEADSDYGTGVVIETRGPNKKVVASQAPSNTFSYSFASMQVDVRVADSQVERSIDSTTRIGELVDPGEFEPFPTGGSTSQVVWQTKRVDIDGLGRPQTVWLSKDDAEDGYKLHPVQRFSYVDGLGSQQPSVTAESRIHAFAGWTKTTTVFDGAGRVETKTEDLSADNVQNATTRYRYDKSGNLTVIEVPDPSQDAGGVVKYTTHYDPLGRVTGRRGPDGGGVDTIYDGRTTTHVEVPAEVDDPNVDPANAPPAVRKLLTDGFGRLVQVHEKVADGRFETTRYEYDSADRMTRITDAEANVTVLAYDYAGNRTQITRGTRVWVYGYDMNGNMTSVLPPLPEGASELDIVTGSYKTHIAYDALDRVTSRMPGLDGLTDPAIGSRRMTTFVYDGCAPGGGCAQASLINAKGRLTRVELPFATIAYEYDARGNAITEQRQFSIPTTSGSEIGDTRTVRRTYTDHGAVWMQSHADGASSVSTMPVAGDPVDFIESQGATIIGTMFDARGLPKMVGWRRASSFFPVATIRRNQAGLPRTRVAHGGAIESGSMFDSSGAQIRHWTYDQLGRVSTDMLRRDVPQANGTSVEEEHPLAVVQYYGTGDVASLTSYLGHTVDFAYDARHQLVGAREEVAPGQFVESALSYTPAGRIDTATVQAPTNGMSKVRERSVSYRYSGDSSTPEQLDTLQNTAGSGAYASFAYDVRGATTERTIHNPVDPQLDKTWRMQYDGDGRLRVLTRPAPSSGSEVYFYDHNGQRMLALERTADGDPVKLRLWMGGTEVHYDAQGSETKTRAHVSLAGPVARIENRTDVEFTYHDGLGHLVLATKPDGAESVAYSYTAFGEVYDHRGDASNHLRRFNGKETDEESGLAYYGYRYYDPVAMQWTRADPLFRFVPDDAYTDPRRGNLYVFSLNNAIRYADPDGLNPSEKKKINGHTFEHDHDKDEYYVTDPKGKKRPIKWEGAYHQTKQHNQELEDAKRDPIRARRLAYTKKLNRVTKIGGDVAHIVAAAALVVVAGGAVLGGGGSGVGATSMTNAEGVALLETAGVRLGGAGLLGAAGLRGPGATGPSTVTTAAPKTYGPFVHHLNKGGLAEIQASSTLRAGTQGSAGFGGTAVRAYIQDPALLNPSVMTKPAIVFETTVPPSSVNVPQSAAVWKVSQLRIVIRRIVRPGGS